MKRPYVDLSECVRCGICTEMYPDLFQMNDAGYVEVVDRDSYPDDMIEEAMKHCPADCIHVEDV